MQMSDFPASGVATVVHECGYKISAVDRYATDFPPGPRGNPESWVQFYRDSCHDPDDLLWECPECGDDVDLETVQVVPHCKHCGIDLTSGELHRIQCPTVLADAQRRQEQS